MNPPGGPAMGVGQNHPARPRPKQPGQPPQAQSQPGVTSSPWDLQAANSEAGALRQRENALTGLGAQWQLTQQRYGLEGPYADLQSNPYSEAAKLQRAYDQARQGSTNSYAARGHLYSGALVGRQVGNDRNYGEGRNSLEMAYAEQGARNTAEKQAAENAYLEAINNARFEALRGQLGEEPDASAAPGNGGQRHPQHQKRNRIRQAVGNNRRAR